MWLWLKLIQAAGRAKTRLERLPRPDKWLNPGQRKKLYFYYYKFIIVFTMDSTSNFEPFKVSLLELLNSSLIAEKTILFSIKNFFSGEKKSSIHVPYLYPKSMH